MVQRKYNFKNGTNADAEQVDAEFDQLIASVNNLIAEDKNIRSSAQMRKITNDVGGVTLSLQKETDDLLASLLAAGQGFYTIYATAAVKNTPSKNAFRGMAHITSDGYGWLKGFDSIGDSYENVLNGAVWKGWNNPQTELWSGAYFMTAAHTITPSKPLSKCRNGWQLIWSDADTGPVKINDFDFAASTFIPKYMGLKFSGKAILAQVPSGLNTTTSSYVNKRLFATDTTITGHDDNNLSSNGTNDVVLRAVIEY